MFIGYAK